MKGLKISLFEKVSARGAINTVVERVLSVTGRETLHRNTVAAALKKDEPKTGLQKIIWIEAQGMIAESPDPTQPEAAPAQ